MRNGRDRPSRPIDGAARRSKGPRRPLQGAARALERSCQLEGRLHELDEASQEPRDRHAVDHLMVEEHGDAHELARLDPIVGQDRAATDGPDLDHQRVDGDRDAPPTAAGAAGHRHRGHHDGAHRLFDPPRTAEQRLPVEPLPQGKRFVLQVALRSAEEVLADQTRFVVAAGAWAQFTALLDRPARVVPALREAVAKPSPFA